MDNDIKQYIYMYMYMRGDQMQLFYTVQLMQLFYPSFILFSLL